MKLNKIFVVGLVILAILTIGVATASDNVTSDNLASDAKDVEIQEAIVDEDLAGGDDTHGSEEVMGIVSDENVVESNDIINEKEVLTSQNTDEVVLTSQNTDEVVLTSQIVNNEVLSAKSLKTFKITFTKQTGKYANNKKVYFKVTDVGTGKGMNDVQIYYKVFNSKGVKVKSGYADTNSKGYGYIDFVEGIKASGTYKIKADVYWWNSAKYGEKAYTYPATLNKVKIKLKTLKITFPKQTGKYSSNKIVYMKLTDKSAKRSVGGAKIYYKVLNSNGVKVKSGILTTNSKGYAAIKFSQGKALAGTFKIKAELYDWSTDKYGEYVYTDPVTLKNVKIYKKPATNSKTNTQTGNGKIKTYIVVKDFSFSINPVYVRGFINYGVSFNAYLYNKDTNKLIKGDHKFTCHIQSVQYSDLVRDFSGTFGEKFDTGVYSDYDHGSLSPNIEYTIKFKGDSNYSPATLTKYGTWDLMR